MKEEKGDDEKELCVSSEPYKPLRKPNPFAAHLRRWILSDGPDCIFAPRLIHTVGTIRGLYEYWTAQMRPHFLHVISALEI